MLGIEIIIGSFISLIVGICIPYIHRIIDYFGGPLAGEWKQIIPEKYGDPEREDFVNCYQRGKRIYGAIERIKPKDDKQKKWGFEGFHEEGKIFLTYHPVKKDYISFGYIFLTKDSGSDIIFNGFIINL